MANVSGGLERGAAFFGLLDLGFDVDLEIAAGLDGLSLHVDGLVPHGSHFSEDFGGDIGVASNLDAYNSAVLFEAWLEQSFFGGKVSLRAGQLALDSEFMGSDSASLFFNSSYGASASLTGNMPVSTYSITTLGVRLRVQPTEQCYLMFGVFDGNADPAVTPDPTPGAATARSFNRHGIDWALRGDEGALLVGEIGYKIHQPPPGEPCADFQQATAEAKGSGKTVTTARGLASSYKAGMAWHTDEFTKLRTGEACDGDWAVYAVFDQELWREPGTDDQGLGVFGRGVVVPPDRNAYAFSLEASVIYRGLIPNREADTFGAAFSQIGLSPDFDRASRREDPTAPKQDYESVIEVTYCVQITPWMSLQPDVQYIFHPGGSGDLDDEWVVGMRVGLTF